MLGNKLIKILIENRRRKRTQKSKVFIKRNRSIGELSSKYEGLGI